MLLQLDGVADRDAAAALVGCTVSVPRAELPPAGRRPSPRRPDRLQRAHHRRRAARHVDDMIVTGANDVCVCAEPVASTWFRSSPTSSRRSISKRAPSDPPAAGAARGPDARSSVTLFPELFASVLGRAC
jgi:hypothetical protein